MSTQEYEFHPYASVLPMLGIAEANELAADIQQNGLRESIVLFEGKILDGRNGYRACKAVSVEPRFIDLNGDGDPIEMPVQRVYVLRDPVLQALLEDRERDLGIVHAPRPWFEER